MLLGPHVHLSLFPYTLQLAAASISESLSEDIHGLHKRQAEMYRVVKIPGYSTQTGFGWKSVDQYPRLACSLAGITLQTALGRGPRGTVAQVPTVEPVHSHTLYASLPSQSHFPILLLMLPGTAY